jgi:drug/metabolite transporter (DMT)-like permease
MNQIRRGIVLAGISAALFGMTAPLLKRASLGVSPLVAGALLYVGAALGAALWVVVARGEPVAGWRALLRRRALARLGLVAALGAAVAPTLLVAGVARTDASTASLLLALEAPFTLLLARLFLKELLGPRVLLAAGLIFAGGVALIAGAGTLDASVGSSARSSGAILVGAATLAWALDNLLSRPLAEHSVSAVVIAKGLLGAAAALVAALATGEAFPGVAAAGPILALGAVGYGISLQFYLRAQRLVGAARTASVFAVAPFIGVAVALAFGAPWPGLQLPVAGVLIGAGLWLHLAERHQHAHRHEALEHDHLHSHDDGHHAHRHDPMPARPHSHPHAHDPLVHEHEHGEDLHHRHAH